MSDKAARRARRERKRLAALERMEAALAIPCPYCPAGVGVWCFMRGRDFPDMHQRRWAAAA